MGALQLRCRRRLQTHSGVSLLLRSHMHGCALSARERSRYCPGGFSVCSQQVLHVQTFMQQLLHALVIVLRL